MKPKKFKNIDEYLSHLPKDQLKKAIELRTILQSAMPEAEEVISYNMPAYRYNGILVYFSSYANHLGFYPTSSGVEAFRPQLEKYKIGKGSIQFPLTAPLPEKLITKICRFRFRQMKEKKKKVKG